MALGGAMDDMLRASSKLIDPAEYAKVGTEHAHQVALFIWASQHFDEFPELRFMFAIPNGGERNVKVASRLKAEGVKAGVADVFLPVPRLPRYNGLFIEMKKPKGVLRPDQRTFGKEMIARGYAFAVAYSWQHAAAYIAQYLKNPRSFINTPL